MDATLCIEAQEIVGYLKKVKESSQLLKEASHAAPHSPANAITSKNRFCNITDIPAYAGSRLLLAPSGFPRNSLAAPGSGCHSSCHSCGCGCVAKLPAADVTFLCSQRHGSVAASGTIFALLGEHGAEFQPHERAVLQEETFFVKPVFAHVLKSMLRFARDRQFRT